MAGAVREQIARLERPIEQAFTSAEELATERTPLRWWPDLFVPLRRATGFYSRAWLDWVGAPRRAGAIPRPRPSLSLALQATVDESLLAVFKVARPPRSPESFRRIEAEVVDALERFEREGWLADPASFHRAPPPLPTVHVEPARAASLAYEHCSWESGYEPFSDHPARDRWLGHTANRTAHAWVLRHEHDAPWLVCIPGAGMGQPLVDLTSFRARWLHETLGCNVAIPVQPLHGPRGPGGRFSVGFPTDDLVDNVLGVAQSAWDIRRLLSWIRSRTDQPVGVHGLSLGGYTASLLAGLDDDLACVIAGVPAVDFASLFDTHAPTRAADAGDYGSLLTLSGRIHHVISPLALPPQVPRERRFVYGGLADRLVDPHDQVRRLWEHWGRPRILWYHGSHIGFFWSREVRAFLHEALVESGLAEDPARVADP